MIAYADFKDIGEMGGFIGQLPAGKFLSVETLPWARNHQTFRVWFWR